MLHCACDSHSGSQKRNMARKRDTPRINAGTHAFGAQHSLPRWLPARQKRALSTQLDNCANCLMRSRRVKRWVVLRSVLVLNVHRARCVNEFPSRDYQACVFLREGKRMNNERDAARSAHVHLCNCESPSTRVHSGNRLKSSREGPSGIERKKKR